MSKNILFLTNSISYGGAAKMLCFVANELQKRNFNISIINYNSTGNQVDYSQKINENINVNNLFIFISTKFLCNWNYF